MANSITDFLSNIPATIDIVSMSKFIGVFAFIILFIGLLGRVVLGIRSNVNHAVSSAMGILFIYAVTVVVYTFDPYSLSKYLAPLPFVTFSADALYIFPLQNWEFTSVCREVLSMVILAFLVNLLDTWISKGRKFCTWLMLRIVTVLLAMVLHYLVQWAFNTFLPGVLVTYAPTILLCILIAMVTLGFSKVILGLVLTVVNPIIGGLYAFFFSNHIGKQITKSVLTTLILSAVVFALNHFGYSVIAISADVLGNYAPLLAVLLLLWYLLGRVL